jgi:hypothetical protein
MLPPLLHICSRDCCCRHDPQVIAKRFSACSCGAAMTAMSVDKIACWVVLSMSAVQAITHNQTCPGLLYEPALLYDCANQPSPAPSSPPPVIPVPT